MGQPMSTVPLRTPLRYPGGKSKAIGYLAAYLPNTFAEFREPFVGGGSMFIYLKQRYPSLKLWINDLNSEVFYFWSTVQNNLSGLIHEVEQVFGSDRPGKVLFDELTHCDVEKLAAPKRAARFFILNRITFSGTIESGGFSQQAFVQRFTLSSIDRLRRLEGILDNAKITQLDYSDVVMAGGASVFIFLDPPYFAATKSKLYGKKGDLHTTFDHEQFAAVMQQCPHPWLLTYDDSPEIQEKFAWAHRHSWELQYGMNNYRQANAAKGKELLIANYPLKK